LKEKKTFNFIKIIGSIINIPMFIGEELGWHGFMTPRLIMLLNTKRAFLAGGVIWAYGMRL
jgi:membrane protease YdiL (CAAX protease family)